MIRINENGLEVEAIFTSLKLLLLVLGLRFAPVAKLCQFYLALYFLPVFTGEIVVAFALRAVEFYEKFL